MEIPVAANLSQGLTSNEARQRLDELGPNTTSEVVLPRWRKYLAKFWGPIPWLLELAFVIQIGIGRDIEAAVIGGLLLFNATLGFIQEGRANAALAALKQQLAPTALVRRDGEWVRLAASELVPGDVVRLPLGALVPADARLVSGSLLVDQSALTGESIPIDVTMGDLVYAGSFVRRGEALAEITATGTRTYFGRAAELVRIAHATSTEQVAIFAVTRNLAIINGLIATLLVLYAGGTAMPIDEVVRLGLTALLATIPAALPATFTLSAALGAQALARRRVLLTRLSAMQEAAAMDVLCADKTGTLTRNQLEVAEVIALPGFDRERVLALAILASSEADQDPIDVAIRSATAKSTAPNGEEKLIRFIPFDPTTKMAEAFVIDPDGKELHIVKGAFGVISRLAVAPTDTRQQVDELAARGNRVITVAMGSPGALRLTGLIAISDPPRADSANLIADLHGLGVRTVMITGDSAATAMAIARKVGVVGDVCPPDKLSDIQSVDEFGVFARVVPEDKYRLVKALQERDHVVGMCGDGTNDAPALKQAQIGIAVSSATDVAKAAAAIVLTEPGLAGVVHAVHEGRIAFQRLLTYTLNMLTKKIEIVLFLAIGMPITGQAVLTPVLVVLMLVTNDFLAMSLTTDHERPAPMPSRWHIGNITATAVILGICKLGFSTAVLAFGKYRLCLDARQLQTLAFVTIVFGAQGLMYALRGRGRLWSSRPSAWVVVSSVADIGIVCVLALSGTLMTSLSADLILLVLGATLAFAAMLDEVKQWLAGSRISAL
jgi:H+-transporting ATPase